MDCVNKRLIVHQKNTCKKILSYGLIVFCTNTKKWLIIQRKHTADILLIMRGQYRLSQLPLLVKNITQGEAELLRKCIDGGTEVFSKIYLEEFELEKEGLEYGKLRMSDSIKHLSGLLLELDGEFCKNSLSWNWPKGRPQNYPEKELPFECAKREFFEEVEVQLPPSTYMSSSYINDPVNTITGKFLESRYWIYFVEDEFKITKPKNHHEIADRKWVSTRECKETICNPKLFEEVAKMVGEGC